MKPLSFLIPAFVLFVSCHGPAGPSSIALTKTSLYSIDTVRLALGGGNEKAATKSSILLKPTAKAYYDLAGALLGARQYKEATDALFSTLT